MTNDDLDSFLYKWDGDGPDYACDNYCDLLSDELRAKAEAVTEAIAKCQEALVAEAERRGLTVPW